MIDFNYEQITGMHLELTTKCNANCPMCARNYQGKTRANLPIAELTLEDCKQLFPKDFLRQIGFISICGVFGDPINAKYLIDIIKYFYSCNENIFINIYTNGGIKPSEWWAELARELKKGYVIFGIDGIGETSEIHRRGTNYGTVISNAQAFIGAGGRAKWDYIVFRHNEEQVEDAKLLSQQLGFDSFQIKKTSRFFKSLYEIDPALDSTILEYGKHPIFDSLGNIVEYLELPNNKQYVNDSEGTIEQLINEYGSMNEYFNQTRIECQAIQTHGIFVSALGEVYPCCTYYQQVCYGSIFAVQDKDELNEFILSSQYQLSAFIKPIREIVEGEFFQKIANSWSCSSLSAGKPKSCCRTCGSRMDMHSATHTHKTNER